MNAHSTFSAILLSYIVQTSILASIILFKVSFTFMRDRVARQSPNVLEKQFETIQLRVDGDKSCPPVTSLFVVLVLIRTFIFQDTRVVLPVKQMQRAFVHLGCILGDFSS